MHSDGLLIRVSLGLYSITFYLISNIFVKLSKCVSFQAFKTYLFFFFSRLLFPHRAGTDFIETYGIELIRPILSGNINLLNKCVCKIVFKTTPWNRPLACSMMFVHWFGGVHFTHRIFEIGLAVIG